MGLASRGSQGRGVHRAPSGVVRCSFSLFFRGQGRRGRYQGPRPPPAEVEFPSGLVSVVRRAPCYGGRTMGRGSRPRGIGSNRCVSQGVYTYRRERSQVAFHHCPIVSRGYQGRGLRSGGGPTGYRSPSYRHLSYASMFLRVSRRGQRRYGQQGDARDSVGELASVSRYGLLPPSSSRRVFHFYL